MQLKDKVAFITGAGSGIGKAAALLFAREGAKIGCLGLGMEKLQKTVDEITQAGGQAVPLKADVSSPEQTQQAVEQLVAKFGRIDIVFANAGINGLWAPIEEISPEEWNRTLSTNLSGTFYTIKYAVPHLKKQGGSVIVTSSVNGTRIFSNTGATAYSTTKAGQVALTQMLALELAKFKIRVNVICPGAIDTNINESTEKRGLEKVKYDTEHCLTIPLTHGKPGTADQVAQLVLFLASDASSHISGTPVWIDGAQSLLQG